MKRRQRPGCCCLPLLGQLALLGSRRTRLGECLGCGDEDSRTPDSLSARRGCLGIACIPVLTTAVPTESTGHRPYGQRLHSVQRSRCARTGTNHHSCSYSVPTLDRLLQLAAVGHAVDQALSGILPGELTKLEEERTEVRLEGVAPVDPLAGRSRRLGLRGAKMMLPILVPHIHHILRWVSQACVLAKQTPPSQARHG